MNRMKKGIQHIKDRYTAMKGRCAELFKKWEMDKWVRRIDRYIIVKFLGTYFFAIALITPIMYWRLVMVAPACL